MDPGAGSPPGAVARTEPGLEGVDQLVERPRIHQLLLDKQRLQSFYAQLDFGKAGAFVVVVIVFAHGKRLNAEQRKTDDTPMAKWRANQYCLCFQRPLARPGD